MKINPLKSVLVLGAVMLVACGTHIRTVALNPPPRPMVPRPAEQVQVFATTNPQTPYVEVAIIEGEQQGIYSRDRMPEIISKMRQEAASAGCDGLILQGPTDRVVSTDEEIVTLEGFTGICVMFVGPDQAKDPARFVR